MTKATVTKISNVRKFSPKAKPGSGKSADSVTISIPRQSYDDLTKPANPPEPPKQLLASDVEAIGWELQQIGDLLRAMRNLAFRTPDDGVTGETLATVVFQLSRTAFLMLDDGCEKLGAIRMGVFDPDGRADETMTTLVQS